jgi:hypothetical protein
MTQSNVALFSQTEYAVKIGTKVKAVAPETLMVLGGKVAAQMLQEAGFATAYAKARAGNYRAAVEIMSLAAHPSQVKATTPPSGVWTKARVTMLAELVLERVCTTKNGWTKNAQKGRQMAHLLQNIDKPLPVPADNADDAKPDTVHADSLEDVAEEAPL